MATLIELAEIGAIVRIDPQLGLKEFEARRIFILPNVQAWIETVLPELGSTWNLEVSPGEQLDALFYEFCVGEPLSVGQRFKALVHLADGIWELKTPDLRLFGWFPGKDTFLVTACNHTEEVKRLKLYRPYCEEAARKRDSLDLNEPKFVAGDNPDDVVSDCY